MHSRGNPDLIIEEPIDQFLAETVFRVLIEMSDRGRIIGPGDRICNIIPGTILGIHKIMGIDYLLCVSLSQASLAD